MPFVKRNAQGFIVGRAAAPQEGWPEEYLVEDHPDLLVELPEIVIYKAKLAATKAEVDGDSFIDKLRTADPTQIKNFVQANVTDLASARQFIGRLAVAVSFALQGGRDK